MIKSLNFMITVVELLTLLLDGRAVGKGYTSLSSETRYTFGMNSTRRILSGMALCGLILASAAAQIPGKNVYVVTHLDIAGTPAIVAEATNPLKEFSADSQKDPGVVRFELLLQDGRLNHFTIVEVWQSRDAFEAHAGAGHTKRFREKIQPMLGSPFDERLHSLLP
jgi:quinol monooxygenase YgiN